MMKNYSVKDLPAILPIFPLTGVLLLPGGQLPLNIFEPRYLAMVDEALRTDRMIGMIQPKKHGGNDLHETGCAGRITSYDETDDGRYLITLSGISRFKIEKEIPLHSKGFRRINPIWDGYESDLRPNGCLDLDRDKMLPLLENYFAMNGMSCEWEKFQDISDQKLMTCLAMVCPFEPQEKQALLEAPCCKSRADTFISMLQIAVQEERIASSSKRH